MYDIVIIDGNNFVMKALHASDVSLTNSMGFSTTAISVGIRMVNRIIEDYSPSAIIWAWDKGRPQWRIDLLKSRGIEYKAGRSDNRTEEEKIVIKESFTSFRSWVSATGMASYSSAIMEADDIVAAIVRDLRSRGNDLKILISSSDKDLYSLLHFENVDILNYRDEIFTKQDFLTKYNFEPRYFDQYKAVVGDSSDKIPGIKGIGGKSVDPIMAEYGNINNFVKRGPYDDKKKGKLYDKLRENSKLYNDLRKAISLHMHDYSADPFNFSYSIAGKEPNLNKLWDIALEYELTNTYILNRKQMEDKIVLLYRNSLQMEY